MINNKRRKLLTLVLSLILVCSMQCANVFGAVIGEQVFQTESGWQRIDDTDKSIHMSGDWHTESLVHNYKGSASYIKNHVPEQRVMAFIFYGSKVRIISGCHVNRTQKMAVYIDGEKAGIADESQPSELTQILVFEKQNMEKEKHKVEIYIEDNKTGMVDAIEIDDDGYMVPFQDDVFNIKEDSVNMQPKEIKALTLDVNSYKYTTSSAIWISSNESVATVNSNGVVTAIAPGKATITAQIDGAELSDSCEINVIEEKKTNWILKIELMDGNIKEFNVTMDQLEDFIQWFKDRDGDNIVAPFYKFVKRNGASVYIVHNKIVAFEVSEN